MNKKLLAEVFGWYGAAAILLAYVLVSFKVVHTGGYVYQLLNLTGGIGIVVISVIKKAEQPAVLNTLWSIVALVAIIGLIVK
jgi:hypothetical protein